MKANVEILAEELKALYFPYTSPNAPKSEGQNPNRGSDPTVIAYHRIQKKREQLDRLRIEYIQKVCEIEDWLETVEDAEVQAIIRCHFINGKTWRETARIVYGYASRETPRLRVDRFLKCTHCNTSKVL